MQCIPTTESWAQDSLAANLQGTTLDFGRREVFVDLGFSKKEIGLEESRSGHRENGLLAVLGMFC